MKKPTHIYCKRGKHIHLLIFDGAKSEGEVFSVLATGIFTAGQRAGSSDQIEYASEMRCAILEHYGCTSSEELAKYFAEYACK